MDPWNFVCIADPQPGSPRSFRYNPSWIRNYRQAQQQINALKPELIVCCGDVTRDGSFHDFELADAQAELDRFACPVYTVPGNMDTGNKHTQSNISVRGPEQSSDIDLNVTSEQLQRFAQFVGPLFWSVDYKNCRFSGIADVAINSNLPEEQQLWQWADEQAKRSTRAHHVWITHYPLFADEPNEPNWDVASRERYTDWYFTIDNPGRQRLIDLFKATGTDLVLSGHVHCHKTTVVDGIRYEIAPATSFKQWGDRWEDGDSTLGFLECTVTDADIESTFIPLAETFNDRFNSKAYGLGGHPAPDQRDYSLAWGTDDL